MLRTPEPLNWAALFPLELSMALAVVGVCTALCLAQVPVILGKAQLTGALLGLAAERGTAVERYALGGELVAPTPEDHAAHDVGRRGFAFRHSGTSVMASGSLQRGDAPFEIAFHPAVGVPDLAWSIVWLCGQRRAPSGLHSVAPPLATRLSAEQLPFICRDTPV